MRKKSRMDEWERTQSLRDDEEKTAANSDEKAALMANKHGNNSTTVKRMIENETQVHYSRKPYKLFYMTLEHPKNEHMLRLFH